MKRRYAVLRLAKKDKRVGVTDIEHTHSELRGKGDSNQTCGR